MISLGQSNDYTKFSTACGKFCETITHVKLQEINIFEDKKTKYSIVMCNKEVHELLIQEGQINCVFCNKQIQEPGKPQRYVCCDSMRLIGDSYLVCKNCGQVNDEYYAPVYFDFHENKHKIRKKSVYHRKYHIINVMNDIAQKNNIQIGYYNRENILRIFKLCDRVSPEVNNFVRKRLINVNFIIKQLFDILGIEYKFIPLTRSRNTLKYYEVWWEKVFSLIKDDINRLISQNLDRK